MQNFQDDDCADYCQRIVELRQKQSMVDLAIACASSTLPTTTYWTHVLQDIGHLIQTPNTEQRIVNHPT